MIRLGARNRKKLLSATTTSLIEEPERPARSRSASYALVTARVTLRGRATCFFAPHHCANSLLEYHRKRAPRAEQKGEAYELTPEQCAELQQEGIQYYHRYLSLFQINDFEGVVRDTQRNLDLFSFVNEHTDREDFSWGLQQFRPYVLMMNTRGKASIFLAQGKFADAMAEIERGREAIVEFLQQSNFPELASKSAEIAFLDEWLEEVKSKRPLSKLEIMQREMETAIAKELYERAAELRDAIKLLKTQKQA